VFFLCGAIFIDVFSGVIYATIVQYNYFFIFSYHFFSLSCVRTHIIDIIMKKILLTTLLVLFAALESVSGHSCYARLEGDTLRVGNSRIERVFAWNDGALRTISLTDVAAGRTMYSIHNLPDFILTKEAPENARLELIEIPQGKWTPAGFVARVSYNIGQVQVRREYRLHEGVPAIACDTYLKGVWDVTLEKVPILDQIRPDGQHWHCRAVEFRDITDHNNNLVEEHKFISYHKKAWNGNLLLSRDKVSGDGLFFLKEAPCSDMQLGEKKGDFLVTSGRVQVIGIGFSPEDLLPDEWTRLYGCVIGVSGNDELSEALALRAYQKTLRRQEDMVMMNTWGDRSQDGRVSEAFCLQELDKAARLGVTVFQIDDGWQVGKSPASVVEGGSFENIWKRKEGYWDLDAKKFPNGLSPIVEKAKSLGIEVGLWFNPSVQDDFADWEKDADVLTSLWRRYGIRIFKIDGLIIPTKKAERNLRKLLDRVREETSDDVIFNMDVTNGIRIGYNWFGEYGNIFLENRYTDWGNYYPYKTLRNLWQLSRYVAPERFQIEFLNPWRNADKYPSEDPFAPANYSFDYLAAISFAAQPLAWLEASNLPEEAFAVGDLLKDWRLLAGDFHNGAILPIGEEPSGCSWTGFQSITGPRQGYLLVYREDTPEAESYIKTWLPKGSRVSLKAVLGNGKDFRSKVGSDGCIKVKLSGSNSFAMYEYTLL
jgi:alpha-galactosidase